MIRSPAGAFAWEFRHRHRWGLGAVAGYLLVIAAIKLLVPESARVIHLEDAWSFAFAVVVPLAASFTYLLAIFSFGLAGDLAARRSMYPARMFTLPATTAALAGWPMLYGTAAMAVLWLATRLFAPWPAVLDLPVLWPALLAALLLAWTQALTWMPYGLRGLRVIVALLWLTTIDAIVILALHQQASELVMVAFLAPQLPLAYLAARLAVGRARRGEVPDWGRVFTRLGREGLERIAGVLPRGRERFDSPERAQAWLEWRRHGRSLPTLVAVLLPFELALLFVAGNAPALVFVILLGVLLTPPFMAAFAGATASMANPHVRDSYELTPFIATRPLTSAALIAAKLKVAAWSTLAAWLLVLVAIPLALEWSGAWPVVMEPASRVAEVTGPLRATVIVLLLLTGFMASTWKQLVQTLYIGLTGRAWMMKANVFLLLSVLVAAGPIIDWIRGNPDVRVALWNAVPWVAAVLVGLKMSAAAWVVTRLHDGRLLSDRALVASAVGWVVAVLAIWGLLVWLASTPHIPRYFLGLIAILSIPLGRLSAAPLALAWNRHR